MILFVKITVVFLKQLDIRENNGAVAAAEGKQANQHQNVLFVAKGQYYPLATSQTRQIIIRRTF